MEAVAVIELRDYQKTLSDQGVDILRRLKICYLAMEVRTGKTLTALAIAQKYGAKRVLFLTKLKAVVSIEKDYAALAPGYELIVTNDESMHKIEGAFDLVIHDEHHRFGAFPKPGKATKLYRQMFGHLPMIFLSGTPTPESYSQIYHQFWVSNHSPFLQRPFYKWAASFVRVTQKYLAFGAINDYSDADIKAIAPIIEPYMLRYSQVDAGFSSVIDEQIVWVQPSSITQMICANLQKDLVVHGEKLSIIADTPVKLQSKLHQLWSGTILFDDGTALTLDTAKGEAIKRLFPDKKLVIFYKFKQELKAIQQCLGDRVTADLDEFRQTDKSIALQIVSGREGLNLSEADAIVFYNIDFSATSYWQARDRMTTMTRQSSKVYWLFSRNGIEEKIYAAVVKKKNYTITMFKKDFGIGSAAQVDPSVRSPGLLRHQNNPGKQARTPRPNAHQKRGSVLR